MFSFQYFYSIKDISIGGQCICYGHARYCPVDPRTGVSDILVRYFAVMLSHKLRVVIAAFLSFSLAESCFCVVHVEGKHDHTDDRPHGEIEIPLSKFGPACTVVLPRLL